MNKVIKLICIANILLTIFVSCTLRTNPIIISRAKNGIDGSEERGVLVNNIKEGYWITFAKDSTIILECYYVHGILNGPTKMYFESGELLQEGIMKNGKSEGYWKSYFDNGNIRSEGKFVGGKKNGIWSFYSCQGKLDKKIQFCNDSIKILIDNQLDVPIPGNNK